MTGLNRKSFLQAGLAGTGALLLPGTGRAGTAVESILATSLVKKAGVSIALGSDIVSLDPHVSQTTFFRMIQTAIWDSLVKLNPQTLQVEPHLATSVKYVSNGTIDITLPEGVVYHSGDLLTSADVVYSLERVLNPATGSPLRSTLAGIKSVNARGPNTVRLTLSQVNPGLLNLLAKVRILSHATDSSLSTHPNGTGPFSFVAWNQNQNIILTAFHKYRVKGLPLASGLTYQIIPDSQSEIAALTTGAVDVVILAPIASANSLAKTSGVKLAPPSHLDIGDVIYMNERRKPFTDPRVRQAVAYAFNKTVYVNQFLSGRGVINMSPHAPKTWAFDPAEQNPYPTNLQRAATLLSQAGYPNGNGLSFDFVFPTGFPEWSSAAQMLQAQLGSIGVKVNVLESQQAVWVQRVFTAFDYDLAFNNIGGAVQDPSIPYSNAFMFTPGAGGVPDWNDPTLANLIVSSRYGGQKQRRAKYFDIQKSWNGSMYSMIICQKQFIHAISSKLQGWVTDPTYEQAWERVHMA